MQNTLISEKDTAMNALVNPESRYGEAFFGLELEHEGSHLFFETDRWTTEGDGSLGSNGCEYILKEPQPFEALGSVLAEWEEGLSTKAVFDNSNNTSTHVHINVSTYTWKQLFSILACCYLCENLLASLIRPNRKGNLFCLDTAATRSNLFRVFDRIANQLRSFRLSDDSLRYSALNLAAISKFGSLEFRQMHALSDVDDIKVWVALLHSLVVRSSKLSLEELETLYLDSTGEAFCLSIFGKEQYEYLKTHGEFDSPDELLREADFVLPLFKEACYRRKIALEEELKTQDEITTLLERTSPSAPPILVDNFMEMHYD